MKKLDRIVASQIFTGLGDPFQNHAIEQLVSDAPDRAKVLEVGCSAARVLSRVSKLGCEVIGVDLHDGSKLQDEGVAYLQADAADLPLQDDQFDLSVACHVLEHVPDYKRALTELVRVTRPGGKIFLAFPNEPVRGLFAVWSAARIFHNPLRAGELHLHKFNVSGQLAVALHLQDLGVQFIDAKNFPLPTPQVFMTFGLPVAG